MPTVEKIIVNGVEREYVLHIPSNMPKNPDVSISCHGGSASGTQHFTRNWSKQVNKGFIIVCPTAGNWQGQGDNWVGIGDQRYGSHLDLKADENFLLAIVDLLKSKYQISKVFMSGFSSGAKMTHHMFVTQSDKFDGFAMTCQGIRDQMATMIPPTVKPVRISFGTADDNFTNPDPEVFDAVETMLWYLEELGHKRKPNLKYKDVGSKRTAQTLVWDDPQAFEMCKVIGAPHGWFGVDKGDPFDEDEQMIKFFKLYAGMK